MSNYQKNKAKARRTAINWQLDFDNHDYNWIECLRWIFYFQKLGKRYGLIKEFKENGII